MADALQGIVRTHPERPPAQRGWLQVPIVRKTGRTASGNVIGQWAMRQIGRLFYFEIKPDHLYRIDDARSVIDVFLTKEKEDIRFRMRVQAPREKVEQIAEALYDEDLSPAQVLFKRTREALTNLIEDSSFGGAETLVERIKREQGNWQRSIRTLLSGTIGLDVEIIFELPAVPFDTDISHQISMAGLKAKDAPHGELELTVSVVLERADRVPEEVLPRNEEELDRLFRTVVKRTFRDSVWLYDYWYRRGRVEQLLHDELDLAVRRHAHKVKSLRINPVTAPVKEEEQISLDVAWSGRLKRNIDFHVETRLSMTENGAGTYDAQGKVIRRDWLHEQVKDALFSAMHGKDFIDLDPDSEIDVRNAVHHHLNRMAERIGHRVDTFLASAVIPEKYWTERVTVSIPKDEYETKNALVKAEFEIDLVVQVASLADLASFIERSPPHHGDNENLGSNREIEREFTDIAKQAARRTMKAIEPQDYFSNFEQWAFPSVDNVLEEQTGQPPYVRDILVGEIQSALNSRFRLSCCEVTIRRVDERVGRVQKRLYSIPELSVDVEAAPAEHFGMDFMKADVNARFSIGPIDAEAISLVLQRGEENLTEERFQTSLEDWSEEYLSSLGVEQIKDMRIHRDPEGRAAFEQFIDARSKQHYGVGVQLISLKFGATDLDIAHQADKSLIVAKRVSDYREAAALLENHGGANAGKQGQITALAERRKHLEKIIAENLRDSEEHRNNLSDDQEELEQVIEEYDRLVEERRTKLLQRSESLPEDARLQDQRSEATDDGADDGPAEESDGRPDSL